MNQKLHICGEEMTNMRYNLGDVQYTVYLVFWGVYFEFGGVSFGIWGLYLVFEGCISYLRVVFGS